MKLYSILNMAQYKPYPDESTPFWIMVAMQKTYSVTMFILRYLVHNHLYSNENIDAGCSQKTRYWKNRNLMWTCRHTLPPSGKSNVNEVRRNIRHNNPKTRTLTRRNIPHVHSKSNLPPNKKLVDRHEHLHEFQKYRSHRGLLNNYSSSPAVWTKHKYKKSAVE